MNFSYARNQNYAYQYLPDSLAGIFAYSCGAIVVVEDLSNSSQQHLIGQWILEADSKQISHDHQAKDDTLNHHNLGNFHAILRSKTMTESKGN